MFRWKKLAVAAAVVAAGAVALSGCSGGGSSTSGSSSAASGTGATGTLTLGLITPATTFAAAGANWANESPYMQAVYDSLLHANPDGTIVPWLATKWSYNADKTVLTMTLRNDVTFTDGAKFTADVAAQNLQRFHDGDSPNKSFLANFKSATAVNPTTLQITLMQPDPAFLTYLSENAGLQESPKAFTASDVKTNPVGSGPYILDTKDSVVGSSYVFTKNPKYWAPQQQHYAKLVMNVYQTSTTILNAIKGGQVNAANTVDNTTIPQIQAAGFTVDPLQLNYEGLLLFDRGGQNEKALGDVRVRQAINYAFDRPALLKAIGRGYGSVTEQIFPTNSPGYEKSLDSYYSYNPTKAKQLLTEAGYKPGQITLTEPSSPFFGQAPYDLVKQELGAIGINVNYVTEGNNFIADILAPKYSSILMVLQEDPTAWQIANFQLLPQATFNPYHYSDATVASLVKTIQTGSTAQADAATKQLNEYIVKQAWFAPWFRPQSSFVSDAHTKVTVQQGNAVPYLWNILPKS